MAIIISLEDSVEETEILLIYRANNWSSSEKPKELLAALNNSHSLVTARIDNELVGLGNAISDGHLVVYYPHMLVHPDHQGQGIGRKMMLAIQANYEDFHQQVLLADAEAVNFYKKLTFKRAGKTEPMWIYAGTDH